MRSDLPPDMTRLLANREVDVAADTFPVYETRSGWNACCRRARSLARRPARTFASVVIGAGYRSRRGATSAELGRTPDLLLDAGEIGEGASGRNSLRRRRAAAAAGQPPRRCNGCRRSADADLPCGRRLAEIAGRDRAIPANGTKAAPASTPPPRPPGAKRLEASIAQYTAWGIPARAVTEEALDRLIGIALLPRRHDL